MDSQYYGIQANLREEEEEEEEEELPLPLGLDCGALTSARPPLPPRPPAMASRIGLRMQLMRDQLQQEERRERQQQQQNAVLQPYMQHRMAGPPAPTPAISTPQHYQSMQVPVEVLKVQTHLENPTDYHIRQSRRQQVKEYLSTTFATKQTVHAVAGLVPPSPPTNMGPTGGSASAPPPLQSPHMRTEQLMSGNSAPNSPMAMLNIGSSHENEVQCRRLQFCLHDIKVISSLERLHLQATSCGRLQMEEVIDDIISMQSNYDDIQAYIDPVQMPNTVSTVPKTGGGKYSIRGRRKTASVWLRSFSGDWGDSGRKTERERERESCERVRVKKQKKKKEEQRPSKEKE
ncbi:hypothetical protein INR49_031028 [Caranx melampygus]|nr:hypothetical protein INR49_031028 [Caranx melampygus]